MQYRNVKTGAVIDARSKMGGDWVPVQPPESAPEKADVSGPDTKPAKRRTKKKES